MFTQEGDKYHIIRNIVLVYSILCCGLYYLFSSYMRSVCCVCVSD